MSELPTITPSEVDLLPGPEWMMLDVRTDAEWAEGRIEGSIHIPLDQLMSRIDEVSDKVICICAVGGRSAQATAYLLSTGRDAINLDGGIRAWMADDRPVSRG
ncbi:rhodanese-like domain-containing protein [Microlunatus sp. Gsoil 973]|uniref:rhodanese-like domain-containing protein n=1 Tax=Microlunatus sp. Gsoil 973 TaxID=2672569 RepID=UPI001E53A428|nr:rhodanese-like domain-containing protein [Microlunatus sp. Gsoil 973]